MWDLILGVILQYMVSASLAGFESSRALGCEH